MPFSLDEGIFEKVALAYVKESIEKPSGFVANKADFAGVARRANKESSSVERAVFFLRSVLLKAVGDVVTRSNFEGAMKYQERVMGKGLALMVAEVATFDPEALPGDVVLNAIEVVMGSGVAWEEVAMAKRRKTLNSLSPSERRRAEEYRVVEGTTEREFEAFCKGLRSSR